jgi:hypothetical protein
VTIEEALYYGGLIDLKDNLGLASIGNFLESLDLTQTTHRFEGIFFKALLTSMHSLI